MATKTIINYLLEHPETGDCYYTGPLAPAVAVMKRERIIRLLPYASGKFQVVFVDFTLDGSRPDTWERAAEFGTGDTPEVAMRYALGAAFGPIDSEYDPTWLYDLIAAADAQTVTPVTFDEVCALTDSDPNVARGLAQGLGLEVDGNTLWARHDMTVAALPATASVEDYLADGDDDGAEAINTEIEHIDAHGLTPILVMAHGELGWVVLGGDERLAAAREVGMEFIAAYVAI